MRSIKLNMSKVRLVWMLTCLGLLLGGCSQDTGHGSLAAGSRYQAEGKYRAAYIEARKVLQSDRQNGAAWLLLGKASLMMGNPEDALDDLQKARAHGAPKAQWVVPAGQVLRLTQHYDKLLEQVTTHGLADAHVEAQVDVLRGDAYLSLKQLDAAAQSYHSALKLAPNHPAALAGLARVAAAGSDEASAEAYLHKAESAAPNDARVWLAKGDLAFNRHDFASAGVAYQKALALKHPAWIPQERFYAMTRLGSVEAAQRHYDKALSAIKTMEKRWPNQPYPHYLHAVVLYRQGHLDDARSALQQVLKTKPDNIRAQLLLGAVNYAQGDFAQAEMYLSNVMGADQRNAQARKLLALTLYREGRSHQALATLRPVAPQHASDTQLLALLQKAATAGIRAHASHAAANAAGNAGTGPLARVRSDIFSGHAAEAIALLKKMPAGDAAKRRERSTLLVMAYLSEKRPDLAVKTAAAHATGNPSDSAAHLLYGTALVAAGQRAAARKQFARAHALAPGDIHALLSLGSLDALEGHDRRAGTYYTAVLKRDPHNAEALTALGRLDMQKGDKPAAIKRFKQAIAAAPKSPNAYLGLMLLYSNGGQFDEAGDTARQLAQAAPDDPSALNALGTTELDAGHYAKALAPLKQAVKLAPDATLFRTNLARAQLLNKHARAAKGNLLQVLKTDPSQVTAVTLLAFLKSQEHDLPGAIALAKTLQKQPATRSAGFGLEGDLYMANKAWSKAAQAYQQGLKTHAKREFVLKRFVALDRSGAAHPASGLRDWLGKHADDAAARMMLAQYYMNRQQSAQAAIQYRTVLKAYPTNIAALNNLAWIDAEQHHPEAVTLAAKAYKLAPRSADVADTYGWALITANQAARALPILTRAAANASNRPSIRYHLALAQARTGDKAAALATLKALRASETDYPEKKAAEKLYTDLVGHARGHAGR